MTQNSYHKKQTGTHGEEYAATYLWEKGYRIVGKNVSSRWGEIDIIAEKDEKIYFIEVKTRFDDRLGKPYESVTYRKRAHLARTINYYILSHKLENRKCQLDVIGILLNPDRTVKELRHYENVEVAFR